MSGYKPYSVYKASGVDWIGEIPEGWEVRPLKEMLLTMFNGTSAEQGPPVEGAVKVTRIESISSGQINFDKIGYVLKTDAISKYRLIAGDIQFSNINSLAMLGNSAAFNGEEEIYAGMNLLVLRPKVHVVPKWLYRVVTSPGFKKQVEVYGKPAINQASISQGALGALMVPVPSFEEQFSIAAHLDRETARIDALITKKTRFIELLREKRQALITHAVTKGLDPKVKMKDSGVEWLGEVPEHWVVKPIKSLANTPGTCFVDGDWIESKNLSESGIRYITTGNVGPGVYKEQGSGYISEETFNELQCIDVCQGDILISRLNAPIGRACIVPDLGGRVVTSVDNVIFRPSQEYLSKYVVYRFSAVDYFHEMGLLASGATMQRISRTELGNVRIAWPSVSEQLAIAVHLDRETSRIDALIVKSERSIDLLKERRSALITAAVTGQIDLRG